MEKSLTISPQEFVESLNKKILSLEDIGIDVVSTKELKLWLSQVDKQQTENIVSVVKMNWTTDSTQ